MAFIVELLVREPARDIGCVRLYKGRVSLKLFKEYIEPWIECKIILRSLYSFFFSINLFNQYYVFLLPLVVEIE